VLIRAISTPLEIKQARIRAVWRRFSPVEQINMRYANEGQAVAKTMELIKGKGKPFSSCLPFSFSSPF
jgi:hypothetical protein